MLYLWAVAPSVCPKALYLNQNSLLPAIANGASMHLHLHFLSSDTAETICLECSINSRYSENSFNFFSLSDWKLKRPNTFFPNYDLKLMKKDTSSFKQFLVLFRKADECQSSRQMHSRVFRSTFAGQMHYSLMWAEM